MKANRKIIPKAKTVEAVKNKFVVEIGSFAEASRLFTLAERRIMLLAIMLAAETGKRLNYEDPVSVLAEDYARHFNVGVRDAYGQIEAGASSLFEQSVTWDDIDLKSGCSMVVMSRWVTSVTYTDGYGIQLRFAPLAVPYLNRLENEFARRKSEMVAVQ